MNYRFHRAALAEHLDQVAFYEGRLPGLGAEYLADFDKVMASVCATPSMYPRALIINPPTLGANRGGGNKTEQGLKGQISTGSSRYWAVL